MAPPSNKQPTQGQQQACQVCSVLCSTFCATCKTAYYCSVDHQKKHRKQHKLDCFPARLEFTPSFGGRCFVASKNIQAGELIFKDKALVSGPSGAEVYFHIICLGCYRSVKGSYKCSSCGWSVCSMKCEKMPHHANNECKIFREAQVEPCVLKPYHYDFINFLRSLLLRDHANNATGEIDKEAASQYKATWEQLLSLESHSEARAKNPFATRLLRETNQFIQETCKLEGKFEPKLIDHVVGVWSINSFGANPPSGAKPGYARMATLLFPKLCLAAHNCIPNTHGILHEDTKGGRPTYTMELIASLPIREGEQIHTTYANICEGTVERREVLQDHYYFPCTCRRCSSPTEFGTFFSSLKCPTCSAGFLISEDPLNNDAFWNCSGGDKCEKSRNGVKYAEFVQKINRIRKEINAAEMEYQMETCIERYEEILDTYKGKVLHPNHWLVIDIEFKLMLRFVSYLSRAKKEVQEERLRRLIELAEHCLRIADVIQPGLNSYRGKILFCLVDGKLKQVVRNTQQSESSLQSQAGNLKSIKEHAEEAIQILAREQGCEEKQVTIMLMQNVKTIDQMLDVIRKHQIKT